MLQEKNKFQKVQWYKVNHFIMLTRNLIFLFFFFEKENSSTKNYKATIEQQRPIPN